MIRPLGLCVRVVYEIQFYGVAVTLGDRLGVEVRVGLGVEVKVGPGDNWVAVGMGVLVGIGVRVGV
jgi:hypothetical protein